jgi:hypothetical protein
MVTIALLIGIYSYVILCLGFVGLLYRPVIIGVTILYILLAVVFKKSYWGEQAERNTKSYKADSTVLIVVLLLIGLLGIAFLGALAPELAFDALWYHLTLPKLYLQHHAVVFVPGGLLSYSTLPKLTEMYYVAALAFSNEILAKLIHFSFGILSGVAVYLFAQRFVTKKFALLAALLFFSNLVVSWEMTTAYIDLARAFFEIMAFWTFMQWVEPRGRKWVVISAFFTGFAIAAKLIAAGSLLIYGVLLIVILWGRWRTLLRSVFDYTLIAFFVPFPWFMFSYFYTGNPFYPLFTPYYHVGLSTSLFHPLNVLTSIFALFTSAADPIQPVYLLVLPFLFIVWKKIGAEGKILGVYVLVSLLVWYLTPQTGGGRFFLPYLPVWSVLVVVLLQQIATQRTLYKVILTSILVLAFTSVVYRGIATLKYLPVVLGLQTQNAFLTDHLNFSYGDFYDTDNYFKTALRPKDTVLLYGFHNLYYVDFPFIDETWVRKGNTFSYIAVQNADLPKRFSNWNLVHNNTLTHVKVYTLPESQWMY